MNDNKLTMNIVEVLHYSNDVPLSVEFYNKKLGWPIIWQSEGNMATFDCGGVYQLTLVSSKWVKDYKEGDPAPPPRLAFESKNLEADAEILNSRGLTGMEITGDPEQMLASEFTDPDGIKPFIWQDNESQGATKVVVEYKAERQPPAIYSLGECLLFVKDLDAAYKFYTEKLDFVERNRHGDCFIGLTKDDGPILGLYYWPNWWEKPSEDSPDTPVRLFFECPDIVAEYKRQKDAGIGTGELKGEPDGLRWFSIADPDGSVMTFWQFVTGTS